MTARAAFPVLLILALALSGLAAYHDRLPGDLWLARRVQDLPAWFETPAEGIRAATETWLIISVGAAAVALLGLWSRRRNWVLTVVVLLLLPFAQAALKDAVDRPRPDPALIERRATFSSESFPSGHVLGGTSVFLLVAASAAERLSHRGRVAAWAIAVGLSGLNGVANVYEGVHWPSDVLGGYLWAGAVLTGVWTASGASRGAGPSN